MAYRLIRPLVVKSYIDGQHDSICDTCSHQEWCRSYKPSKRVFSCDRHSQKKKRRQKKRQLIITQPEEERICEKEQQAKEK